MYFRPCTHQPLYQGKISIVYKNKYQPIIWPQLHALTRGTCKTTLKFTDSISLQRIVQCAAVVQRRTPCRLQGSEVKIDRHHDWML